MAPLLNYRLRAETQRIILHSSHTTPEVGRAETYLRVHGRVQGLLDIGYHFVVERSGMVIESRKAGVVGSHTPGHNRDSIGICFAGGMESYRKWDSEEQKEVTLQRQVDDFPPLQLDSGLLLVSHLMNTWGVKNENVLGHTEIQRYRDRDLRCPGFDMRGFRLRLPQ